MKTASLAIAFILAIATTSPALAAGPAGDVLFRQRCQACHVIGAGKAPTVGPNLSGVVGRKAGSTAYNYSAALKGSKLVWTRPVLDKFLTAPAKLVPGTKMVIGVPDAAQRGAIIAWLSTQR